MMTKYYNIPLLILVLIGAVLAFAFWGLGLSGLVEPLKMGDIYLTKSIAGLAKDALFVPLKPVMYALIILSIGASIAISRGGMGAKFLRVLSFFINILASGSRPILFLIYLSKGSLSFFGLLFLSLFLAL